MYIPDLSPYQFLKQPRCVAVGWLDGAHPFEQGEVSQAFVERLWAFCKRRVNGLLGKHGCDFCPPSKIHHPDTFGEDWMHLGTAEIRVFGNDTIVYAAPNLIYHYVVKHQYRPPEEFIQAVLTCPLPDTPAYETLVAPFDT